MQKRIFKTDKHRYIIPVVLFFSSLTIFSFNLGGQGPYADEVIYQAHGLVIFNLTNEDDILNPCFMGPDSE